MNHKTIRKIAQNQKNQFANWDFVGVRIQKSAYGARVGDTIKHISSVWDDGNELDEKINGVSAVDARRADRLDEFGGYDGKVALVLGSNDAEGGNDPAEIIMRDAVILAIVKC